MGTLIHQRGSLYRTATFEDLADTQEMKDLTDQAISLFEKAQTCLTKWLEHAKEVGDTLNRIKAKLKDTSKWTRWRRERFKRSKRTSCLYMRIADHWKHPDIVEARERGALTSISEFDMILRNANRKKQEEEMSDEERARRNEQEEINKAKKSIRERFAVCLDNALRMDQLTKKDLELLDWAIEDKIWPKIIHSVKHDNDLREAWVADQQRDRKWRDDDCTEYHVN